MSGGASCPDAPPSQADQPQTRCPASCSKPVRAHRPPARVRRADVQKWAAWCMIRARRHLDQVSPDLATPAKHHVAVEVVAPGDHRYRRARRGTFLNHLNLEPGLVLASAAVDHVGLFGTVGRPCAVRLSLLHHSVHPHQRGHRVCAPLRRHCPRRRSIFIRTLRR
jgi:hypothetical protein